MGSHSRGVINLDELDDNDKQIRHSSSNNTKRIYQLEHHKNVTARNIQDSLLSAATELCDNAVGAEATEVRVNTRGNMESCVGARSGENVFHKKVLCFLDNGRGIPSEATMSNILDWAGRGDEKYKRKSAIDIGQFGMGMKTAARKLAERMLIISSGKEQLAVPNSNDTFRVQIGLTPCRTNVKLENEDLIKPTIHTATKGIIELQVKVNPKNHSEIIDILNYKEFNDSDTGKNLTKNGPFKKSLNLKQCFINVIEQLFDQSLMEESEENSQDAEIIPVDDDQPKRTNHGTIIILWDFPEDKEKDKDKRTFMSTRGDIKLFDKWEKKDGEVAKFISLKEHISRLFAIQHKPDHKKKTYKMKKTIYYINDEQVQLQLARSIFEPLVPFKDKKQGYQRLFRLDFFTLRYNSQSYDEKLMYEMGKVPNPDDSGIYTYYKSRFIQKHPGDPAKRAAIIVDLMGFEDPCPDKTRWNNSSGALKTTLDHLLTELKQFSKYLGIMEQNPTTDKNRDSRFRPTDKMKYSQCNSCGMVRYMKLEEKDVMRLRNCQDCPKNMSKDVVVKCGITTVDYFQESIGFFWERKFDEYKPNRQQHLLEKYEEFMKAAKEIEDSKKSEKHAKQIREKEESDEKTIKDQQLAKDQKLAEYRKSLEIVSENTNSEIFAQKGSGRKRKSTNAEKVLDGGTVPDSDEELPTQKKTPISRPENISRIIARAQTSEKTSSIEIESIPSPAIETSADPSEADSIPQETFIALLKNFGTVPIDESDDDSGSDAYSQTNDTAQHHINPLEAGSELLSGHRERISGKSISSMAPPDSAPSRTRLARSRPDRKIVEEGTKLLKELTYLHNKIKKKNLDPIQRKTIENKIHLDQYMHNTIAQKKILEEERNKLLKK